MCNNIPSVIAIVVAVSVSVAIDLAGMIGEKRVWEPYDVLCYCTITQHMPACRSHSSGVSVRAFMTTRVLHILLVGESAECGRGLEPVATVCCVLR